jgi:hypothetical protein
LHGNLSFKYLKENTIAVVDKEQKDTYSKESICWLEFIMSKENINIQHALNGGEKQKIGNKVDGYCEEQIRFISFMFVFGIDVLNVFSLIQ